MLCEQSGQDVSMELGMERVCFYQLSSALYKNISLTNEKKKLQRYHKLRVHKGTPTDYINTQIYAFFLNKIEKCIFHN